MVYSGKPSAGCRTCRTRRIKCDETKPTCNQCTKSKRECGGYPDPDDLIFQHQTLATIKKVRREEGVRKRASVTASPNSQDGSEVMIPNSSESQVLILNPSESIETAAISFYLQGIIVEPSSTGKCLGHFELLPKLYLQAGSDSVLAKVTTAMCLGALCNFGPENSPIMKQALEAYSRAVVALHQALKDPRQRSKNDLLMAVSCMQAVEALLAWHKAPTSQWASHVGGAAGLLKSRGNQVLDDPVASRIFMIVRYFVQKGCNERGQPLDPFFAQSVRDSVKMPDSPEVRLSPITKGLNQLRRQTLLALQTPEDTGNLAVRLNELQWMDEALVSWATDLPESYQYDFSSSPVSPDDLEFNLQEHRYQDPYSHRWWNSYRTTRIFANALAYRCLLALSGLGTDECLQNMQDMASEICSSVPVEMRQLTSTASQPFKPGQQAVVAFFLLWPLLIARGVLTLPQSQRQWTRATMMGIAEKYQIRRAMALVHASDEDERRPLWLDSWENDIIEHVWEASFLYGTGTI